jgi:hypothetical protein
MVLLPANGSTVPAGTPVTFSGESTNALTFDIASSEALLASALPSPDIDSGLGSQSGAHYEFTSTKATAAPRTIYWRASFTFTPEDCETPATFFTPVQTLIVTQSEAERAAAKRQQEAEAAEREREATAGTIAMHSLLIDVRGRRDAAIRLTCSDLDPCTGELVLTVRVPLRKGKARRTKTITIADGKFSIAAEKTETVDVALHKGTVGLFSVAGHLEASLTIRRTSPLPVTTEIKSVRLVQRTKATGR